MRTRQFVCSMIILLPVLAYANGFEAKIDWARKVELGLRVSGRINHIAVESGDRVKAGQELLHLNPIPFDSDVERDTARLARARAELQEAERALKRTQELYNRGLLATVPLQQAELQLARAKSEVQTGEAALKNSRYRLDSSRLLAPFDAWVIKQNAIVGQVSVGDLQPPVLMTLGEAGVYLARAQVDSATAGRLSKGAAARIMVGTESYSGTVRSIALEPDSQSRFTVEAVFNSDTRPQIGSGARIDFP